MSNFIAGKAKKSYTIKILCHPQAQRRTLDPATVALVKDFYQNDEISNQMSGKNDCFSKKIGKCVHVQKYLILSTLREAYDYLRSITQIRKLNLLNIVSFVPSIVFFLVLCSFAQYIRYPN